jgi:hypothetical protein
MGSSGELATAALALAVGLGAGCSAGTNGSGTPPWCRTPAGCFPGGEGDADADDGSHDDDGDSSSSISSGDADPSDGDDGPSAEPGMPCDVNDALVRACGMCHGETPTFGAPMPLATWADLQVPAKSDPTRKVYELVAERITAEVSPMPPSGDITDEEKATLLAWIANGAPADPSADCDDMPDPTGDEPDGPDALPCDASFELRAHDESGSAFKVPTEGADDLYECFSFTAPFSEATQALAWAPIIDDERVIHHWILYRKHGGNEPDGGVYPCDVSLQVTTEFVAGWAPGGTNVEMPEGVGLQLAAPGDTFILQIHYHNTMHYDDAFDTSGVAFCLADTPEPQTAGIVTLGTVGINIPAGAQDHQEVGNCGFLNTVFWPELHIIGASPHMHQLGRAFKTELLRSGGVTETVVDVPAFNFENQIMYFVEPEIVVNPGETLRTTCTYDNPGPAPVQFGEATTDEMCFDFVLAYPIEGLGDRNCGIVL